MAGKCSQCCTSLFATNTTKSRFDNGPKRIACDWLIKDDEVALVLNYFMESVRMGKSARATWAP